MNFGDKAINGRGRWPRPLCVLQAIRRVVVVAPGFCGAAAWVDERGVRGREDKEATRGGEG